MRKRKKGDFYNLLKLGNVFMGEKEGVFL